LLVEFEFLIAAHFRWKLKMRTAALMKQRVDEKAMARDNVCEVGECLQKEFPAALRFSPAYTRAVSEHASFHREAGKVAALINAGRYEEALSALDAGTAYAMASQAAVAAINSLRAAV
jgi:hypothetical protein